MDEESHAIRDGQAYATVGRHNVAEKGMAVEEGRAPSGCRSEERQKRFYAPPAQSDGLVWEPVTACC